MKTQPSSALTAKLKITGATSRQTIVQHSSPMTDEEWEAWQEQADRDFLEAARRGLAEDPSPPPLTGPQAVKLRRSAS